MCACVLVGLPCVHVSLNREMIKCVPTFEWSHILNMYILSNKINIFLTIYKRCNIPKLSEIANPKNFPEMHVQMHAHMHSHMHVHMHVHMHAQMHAQMHAHMHAHKINSFFQPIIMRT